MLFMLLFFFKSTPTSNHLNFPLIVRVTLEPPIVADQWESRNSLKQAKQKKTNWDVLKSP